VDYKTGGAVSDTLEKAKHPIDAINRQLTQNEIEDYMDEKRRFNDGLKTKENWDYYQNSFIEKHKKELRPETIEKLRKGGGLLEMQEDLLPSMKMPPSFNQKDLEKRLINTNEELTKRTKELTDAVGKNNELLEGGKAINSALFNAFAGWSHNMTGHGPQGQGGWTKVPNIDIGKVSNFMGRTPTDNYVKAQQANPNNAGGQSYPLPQSSPVSVNMPTTYNVEAHEEDMIRLELSSIRDDVMRRISGFLNSKWHRMAAARFNV